VVLALDVSPGGPSANSYATRAEGDSYHEGRLYISAWTNASGSDKDRALVMATRVLDSSFRWEGFPTFAGQALDWPRQGLMAKNRRDSLPDSSIPKEIKDATAELARQLLEGDRTADQTSDVQGIAEMSAGPVSIKFKEGGSGLMSRVLPLAVSLLIPSWWGTLRPQHGASGQTVRVVRT
jgi:hypothetical protein